MRVLQDLQRCIFRGKRSTKDMVMRDVRTLGGQGADFLRRVAFWSIRSVIRFAKMILRDRCSTSHYLASIFRGRRSTLDRWSGKNCKTHRYEAVSLQNCFVFDAVKFNN